LLAADGQSTLQVKKLGWHQLLAIGLCQAAEFIIILAKVCASLMLAKKN
jgi:hypothetical protein